MAGASDRDVRHGARGVAEGEVGQNRGEPVLRRTVHERTPADDSHAHASAHRAGIAHGNDADETRVVGAQIVENAGGRLCCGARWHDAAVGG